MQRCSRITVMDGEVVTLAPGFFEGRGAFGPRYGVFGPWEISISKKTIIVKGELESEKELSDFRKALDKVEGIQRALCKGEQFEQYPVKYEE